MDRKRIERLEQLMDERREIALYTEEQMGNNTGCFLPNNPDYIYYKGVLEAVYAMGFEYSIENGKHIIYD